jgi:hypothetical protein
MQELRVPKNTNAFVDDLSGFAIFTVIDHGELGKQYGVCGLGSTMTGSAHPPGTIRGDTVPVGHVQRLLLLHSNDSS